MNDVAHASTIPPSMTPGERGVVDLTLTAANAVETAREALALVERLTKSNAKLRADNERLRVVASCASALCIALDNIPLGMNPGPRTAVVDAVAARILLVERLADLSR